MLRTKLKFVASILAAAILFSSIGVLADDVATQESTTTANGILSAVDTNTVEVLSNRHTQADSTEQAENRMDLEGFEKKLENDALEIWFKEDTVAIRIVDKANGYIWGGLSNEEGVDLNKKWRNFANSICTIDYFDDMGSEQRLSISDNSVTANYNWSGSKLTCTFDARRIGIKFDFSMVLDDRSLTFEISDDSLEETGDSKIKSLYFMPFLGSAYQDEINGYIFIPDGCGALMRFTKSFTYASSFDSQVYGQDGAIDAFSSAGNLQAKRINEYLIEANEVTMPVYGFVHGYEQNAVLAVIEDGEEYAAIEASPAGGIVDYHWATARFIYRKQYVDAISGSGKGITTVQKKPNEIDTKISFNFIQGAEADYSGMANLYREKLIADGQLSKERIDSDIPLRLEMVAATAKDGFIFDSVKALTTTSEAAEILEGLNEDGVNNITFVYRGWQNGASEMADYAKFKAGRKIGGKRGLSALFDTVTSLNSRMYLYTNPVMTHENQIYKSSDTAIRANESFIYITAADINQMYPTKFLAKISRIPEYIDAANKKFSDYSFAYDSLGSSLYSDYTKKKAYTRKEAMETIISKLSEQDETALYVPNKYAWKYTNDYFDIPVNCSQYRYESDTVPFLQMVLKGSMDYYSTYVNQSYCSQNTILKMVEYAVYPSFITMAAENTKLSGTAMSNYFSLCFDDWEDDIKSVYSKVNEAISAVEGAYITEHKAIYDGTVRVTYSNGVKIYVNYYSYDVQVDGITVPAQQYLIYS